MQIRSYNDNPQGFLDDVSKADLTLLTGLRSSELLPLVDFIKEKGIQISASGSSPFINEKLLTKMLAYFMPEDAIVKGGHLDRQIRGGIEHLKELLTSAVAGSPTAAAKTTWSLQEFMALAHFSLTGDRVDDDIIAVMAGTMKNHSDKRDKLKDEVGALTAELRIYAVIQAEINNKLSATPRSGSDLSALVFTNTIFINDQGLNLMDYHLYGYPNQDAFEKSEEYDLLIGIASDKNKLTIKAFLESGSKSSGSMSGLSDTYSYDKDNNKLGNFATTVGDKSRPLNDKVSQKTTELNDISSRYNSAIEALNRFIQKYESMMQQILQAI
ncbi:virulence-associated V antigen [Aeromonas schubertii]|uniref:Virulence-associated V antigen n=1 Tax=Aeromonas schubertii TaxID=652 RepID=A0ABS7VBD8_9GAMM|nr:virulence-associated V antigen [Aeromonas schubertii]MBZ6066707.1 virulence-associated V antigen [Aeromonas schubertii]